MTYKETIWTQFSIQLLVTKGPYVHLVYMPLKTAASYGAAKQIHTVRICRSVTLTGALLHNSGAELVSAKLEDLDYYGSQHFRSHKQATFLMLHIG